MTDAAPATDERLQAMLSDYVDGTLTAEERAEVDAALAADPALRAELEEVRDSMKLLKSLPPAAAPADLGRTVEVVYYEGGKHGWPSMLLDIRHFADWFDLHLQPGQPKPASR